MALSGETDLSFINNTTPTGLICIDLLTDLVLLAVGKEHPLCKDYDFGKRYPKINLRLFKDDFFALTSRNSNLRRISNEIFNDYNFMPKVSIETYSLELTHQLAAQNTAVALILDSLLKLYPDENRVCYFLFDRNEYHNELYICYKKNWYLTNIMSDFIRITQEVVKQQEYRFRYGPNLPNAPDLLSPWW